MTSTPLPPFQTRPRWSPEEPTPRPMGCAVYTASDTRDPSNDTSGDLIVGRLLEAGHRLLDRGIIREDQAHMREKLAEALARPEIEVVLITGGTGVTTRDVTPEVVESLSTKSIPGFGELFRLLSYADIGTSTIQSRACAHLCGETLVFALPGSTGAVRLAMDEILIPQLDVRHTPCNFAQLMPRIRGGVS